MIIVTNHTLKTEQYECYQKYIPRVFPGSPVVQQDLTCCVAKQLKKKKKEIHTNKNKSQNSSQMMFNSIIFYLKAFTSYTPVNLPARVIHLAGISGDLLCIRGCAKRWNPVVNKTALTSAHLCLPATFLSLLGCLGKFHQIHSFCFPFI